MPSEFEVAWEEYAVTHDIEHPGTARDIFATSWDAAITAAQETLVRRDAFTERSLRLLDGLYIRE